jgi:hypothetical protein
MCTREKFVAKAAVLSQMEDSGFPHLRFLVPLPQCFRGSPFWVGAQPLLPGTLDRVKQRVSHRKQMTGHAFTRNVPVHTSARLLAAKLSSVVSPTRHTLRSFAQGAAMECGLTCYARGCYQSCFVFWRRSGGSGHPRAAGQALSRVSKQSGLRAPAAEAAICVRFLARLKPCPDGTIASEAICLLLIGSGARLKRTGELA